MKFSELKNQDALKTLIDLLDYDDREPPNWHGQIGDCVLHEDGDALIVTNSWADPRRGTNEEKLVVLVEDSKKGEQIILQGWDDRGKDFRVEVPSSIALEEIVDWMLVAAQSDTKRASSLLNAITAEFERYAPAP